MTHWMNISGFSFRVVLRETLWASTRQVEFYHFMQWVCEGK